MKERMNRIVRRLLYSIWNKEYYIKRGYIHRKTVPHFDDTAYKDEWQDEVYAYAKTITDQYNFRSILDYGCGSGYKLFKYFNSYNITGLEVNPALQYLKEKYPSCDWLHPDELPGEKKFDLLILSDVVEHIANPETFLKDIINKVSFRKIIISTPERDNRRGKNDWGPPRNIYHYREWNFKEFGEFLSSNLIVESHFITSEGQNTQVALCSVLR